MRSRASGSAAPWYLLLFAATASLAACAGSSADSQISGTGSGGTTGSHCTTTACLPPLATSLTWDVQIDPPSSASAAATQLPGDLYDASQQLTLVADSLTPVTAIFSAPPNAAAPASANVVLTLPPLIPGTPSLTFQAPAVATSSNVTGASLSVPTSRLGSTVTMSLIPLPPADQQTPPYTFSVPLAEMLAEDIASDNFSINGTLLLADAMPPGTTFVARAFQKGAQVSNAPLTQADGSFQLLIPSTAKVIPSTAKVAPLLTVQLTPQGQTDPWFVSNSIPPADPIPTPYPPFMLAAYTAPSPITVVVKDADNNNVSGALLQAETTVGSPSLGTTNFARSATTNSNGTASISLLPGSKSAPLTYSFVVIPPAGSSAATTCFPSVTLPVIAPATLLRRPSLFGTVTDGEGNLVANVAITATPGSDPVHSCQSTAAAPGNTTTDANGAFSLPLDPGTYQLDYDPPAGSAAPRLTEYGVVIGVPGGGADGGTNAGTEMIPHPVSLPVAAAVQGTVVATDGTPLPSATVRFFEARGTDAGPPLAPLLRAQTVTDANGAFRVAVPLPN